MVSAAASASILLCSLLAGAPAARQRVAVLEVKSQASAAEKVDTNFLKLLADGIRQGAVGATSGSVFDVMTRETIAEIQENMPACTGEDAECAVSAGEMLNADFVLGSELAFFGDRFFLKLEFYNVKTKALLKLDRVVVADKGQLIDKSPAVAQTMVRDGLRIGRGGSGFGGGVELRVPTIDTSKTRRLNLSELNPELESLYARALKLQNDPKSLPEDKAQAWCALAAITEKNRYLETATAACDGWRKYVSDITNLKQSLASDYDKIAMLLGLEHISPDEKMQYVAEFVDTYSILEGDPLVAEVRKVQESLKTGQTVVLKTTAQMREERETVARAAEEQRRAKEDAKARREGERAAQDERRRQERMAEEERHRREEAASEQVSQERQAKFGRVFSGETAGNLVMPTLRIGLAAFGTLLELILPPIGLALAVLFSGTIAALGSTALSSVSGFFSGSNTVLIILIAVLVPTFAVIVAIALSGGAFFGLGSIFKGFKPIFETILSFFVGTNLTIRPMTAILHKAIGGFAYICSCCAPFCVLDYCLGFGAVVKNAWDGTPMVETPPPAKEN